ETQEVTLCGTSCCFSPCFWLQWPFYWEQSPPFHPTGEIVSAMSLAITRWPSVFEGSVESKPYMIEQIVYFPLRTANSVVQVQVGPKDFIERSNFKIKASDMLTVTGMPIVMNGRDVVLAREIRSANGVLVLRDSM